MKKLIFIILFLSAAFILYAQLEQHEILVTNIAVPTRVFDGDQFVANLTIEDFELFEDGVAQKIEALYLTNKTKIEKSEELKSFFPGVSRHYFLLFQLTEYHPKLSEAIDYLFNDILLPEDTLTIMTPVKNYSLPKNALQRYSKKQISDDMQNLIRKDTKIGSSNYRSLLRDLTRLVSAISGSSQMGFETSAATADGFSIELLLNRYRDALTNMDNLRWVDQKWFMNFAQLMKKREGQKNVFLFYEREYRPEIKTGVLNRLESEYQQRPDILAQVRDLFQFYNRDARLNAKLIKQLFADSLINFYFIFLNKDPGKAFGITMREQSEDVFSTFKEVTKATGGIIDTSQNPAVGFKNAMNASENCYLLYYSPKDYKRDGKFKNITVKVKNREYKIKNREGYFAR